MPQVIITSGLQYFALNLLKLYSKLLDLVYYAYKSSLGNFILFFNFQLGLEWNILFLTVLNI